MHSGYKTEENIEKEISKYDQRFHVYKRIMRALGFSRMPSEAERQIMDNWMELGVAVGTMVEACGKTAGISNPNIKYVDKIKGRAFSICLTAVLQSALKVHHLI